MSIFSTKSLLSIDNHIINNPFKDVKIKNAKVSSEAVLSILYPGILDEETEDMTRYISELQDEQ